jgi:NitT/TauT family transport system substrate-binding protein
LSVLAAATAFAIGVVLLPGCRKSSPADGQQVVRIGYFANLTHAQAVLGVASGDFAKAVAPAKLETKLFNAGPSLIEALFAGEIDIGYVGPGPVISAQARSHGKGIRVVAGAAADGVALVVRKDSGITSLAQLAGRKLATPQLGNTQDISARHYLSQVLGQKDLGNVTPVENSQQAALFARNEIDAAWVPEPWGQVLISQTGATLLAEEKDLWPEKEFVLTEVVTSPEFLAKHPDTVEQVLRAHRVWTDRLTRDPGTYAAPLGDALFGLTGKRLGASILKDSLARVKFTDDPNASTLKTFASWTHDLGFERYPVDLNDLVDTKILQQLLAEKPTAGRDSNPSLPRGSDSRGP